MDIGSILSKVAIKLPYLEKIVYQINFEYIQEVEKNPLARAVKLSDLEHNLDVRRLKRISDSDLRRIRKYWAAWKYLKKEISAEKAQNMIEKKEG